MLSWWLMIQSALAQPATPGDIPPLPEDPAAIMAIVGQSPILWGELQPKVDGKINAVLKTSEQEIPEDQISIARMNLTRSLLSQTIQNKMLRESFLLNQVGTQESDKRAEVDAQMVQRARQLFRESEMPKMLKQYKTSDRAKLDKALHEEGTSLAAKQNDFVDRMLGHLYIREKVAQDPRVSLAEIVGNYQKNKDQYEQKERARWEQLSVYFDRTGSEDEAKEKITAMGREAFFGGSMTAVAKRSSHDPMSSSGGVHDWTDRGALASEIMEDQIFKIPTGQMSEIIRDDVGFHIIRVLDRTPAGLTPLAEVQDAIRDSIKQQKIADSQREALESMKDRVAVWSLYPDDVPGAKPLPRSLRR